MIVEHGLIVVEGGLMIVEHGLFVKDGSFYSIITNVPAMINAAPMAVLSVNASLRKITDKTIVNATLNLSTGATCDTFPVCNALK